jgi:hypothetical protein
MARLDTATIPEYGERFAVVMSPQAFDQVEVGEVTHIGIGIPAGVGSDVK